MTTVSSRYEKELVILARIEKNSTSFGNDSPSSARFMGKKSNADEHWRRRQAASLELRLASVRIFQEVWAVDLAWVLRGKGARKRAFLVPISILTTYSLTTFATNPPARLPGMGDLLKISQGC